MKALSVRQPWAELIMLGWKPWENRTWPTRHRGRLIIHAPMTEDDAAGMFMLEHGIVLPWPTGRGMILGTVDIVSCERIEALKDPGIYAFGPWCWGLKNARRLERPIRYMGRQGLFDITEPYVLEQLPQ